MNLWNRLTPTEIDLLTYVADAAADLSVPAYVVGGFVRDLLLNRPCKDIDFVCVGDGVALAEAVASKMPHKPHVHVFKRFGTAMLRTEEFELEFVGARKESYRSDSRKPDVKAGTLEDDQLRRDFTINALAIALDDAERGELIDPFDGLADLDHRTIKTPTDPERTFDDDPLRMMRAIRFAAQLDFGIHEDTLAAIARYKDRISIVSKERITVELNKIIESPIPSVGFHHLMDTGLLSIIFPEMHELRGVDTRDGLAHKDNFYHTLEVLDNLSMHTADLWLRWAAILHDIAKPATKRFQKGHGWTFHGHEVVGARMVKPIFRRMKLPMDAKMKLVEKLVMLHLRPISLTKDNITDSAIRRLIFDAGDDLESLMMLCEADITSKNPKRVERYMANYQLVRHKIQEVEDRDQLRNWEPPVTGEDIMTAFGIKPSRVVGTIKKAIREAILDGDIPNEREPALARMYELGAKEGLNRVTELT